MVVVPRNFVKFGGKTTRALNPAIQEWCDAHLMGPTRLDIGFHVPLNRSADAPDDTFDPDEVYVVEFTNPTDEEAFRRQWFRMGPSTSVAEREKHPVESEPRVDRSRSLNDDHPLSSIVQADDILFTENTTDGTDWLNPIKFDEAGRFVPGAEGLIKTPPGQVRDWLETHSVEPIPLPTPHSISLIRIADPDKLVLFRLRFRV
jgi:hypothetical protein